MGQPVPFLPEIPGVVSFSCTLNTIHRRQTPLLFVRRSHLAQRTLYSCGTGDLIQSLPRNGEAGDGSVDGMPDYQTDLKNPNFAKLAEAIGMMGVSIENPADVSSGLKKALAHSGPALIDVVTDPNALSLPSHISADQVVGFGPGVGNSGNRCLSRTNQALRPNPRNCTVKRNPRKISSGTLASRC